MSRDGDAAWDAARDPGPGWMTPGQIADAYSVKPVRVGMIIGLLGLRDTAHHVRFGDKITYSPEAVAMVVRELRSRGELAAP